MTRHSYQKGHLEGPFRTSRGIAFKGHYRVRGANGAWKQRKTTIYKAKMKEARTELDRVIAAETGRPAASDDLTVRGFVDAYWNLYLDRRNAKPSTRATYRSALEAHIYPAIGDQRLQDVLPLHVEKLVQEKLAKGLSAKTVRNLVGIMQGIFSLAVENDLIVRSPVRKGHKPSLVRREKPVWTSEQVRKILDAAPLECRALIVCVGLTGVRLGELLGLQWKHVDFKNGTLRIQQSLWRGHLGTPKTNTSVRTIHIGDALAVVLKVHRATATHTGPDSFVFSKPDGLPLCQDVLRRNVLYPILDRLNIPRGKGDSGFHRFRHSVSSFINAETGNLKLAQDLLGHATINMTADVYTHTSDESKKKGALAVERAIYGGEMFPNVPQTGNISGDVSVN